ncbi:MAG: hypothetical protein J5661_00480 [Bacteroidaceae bacterium]|nr:hypothetical protein [Bacteroidaceae bacterium]
MATFLLASCSRGVRMPKELVVIDSLVDANPDSALVLLSQMDAGKENTSFRMYMELLHGKAINSFEKIVHSYLPLYHVVVVVVDNI